MSTAMLLEALQYCITPCRPLARRHGHLHQAIALEARHRRCDLAWKPHITRCKRAIRRALARSSRHRCALVLGSGTLRDLPLEDLCQTFERVILADLVHLRSVRRAAKQDPKIELVEEDISGFLENSGTPEATFSPGLRRIMGRSDLDLVVSLNLLSQLPLAPLEALGDRSDLDEHTLIEFGGLVVRTHLDLLRQHPAQSCLISDVEHRHFGADGELLLRQDLLFGESLPPADDSWEWELAPLGEVDPQRRIQGVVGSWIDF